MTLFGHEILDLRPAFAESPTIKGSRPFDLFEGGPARRGRYVRGQQAQHVLSFDFLLQGQDEIRQLSNFFYQRAGKWDGFWIPSWHAELAQAFDILAGETELAVHSVEYDTTYAPNPLDPSKVGNWIWMLHIDGTFHVTAVTDAFPSGAHDLLTIATPPARDFIAGDCMIGFLYFVRFLGDELELIFDGPDQASANLSVIEIPGPDPDPADACAIYMFDSELVAVDGGGDSFDCYESAVVLNGLGAGNYFGGPWVSEPLFIGLIDLDEFGGGNDGGQLNGRTAEFLWAGAWVDSVAFVGLQDEDTFDTYESGQAFDGKVGGATWGGFWVDGSLG